MIRRCLRQVDDFRKIQRVSFEPRWNVFTQFSKELSANGFVFVENFLVKADYEILKGNWPKTRFFTPVVPNEDHKTSDKGLYCQRGFRVLTPKETQSSGVFMKCSEVKIFAKTYHSCAEIKLVALRIICSARILLGKWSCPSS